MKQSEARLRETDMHIPLVTYLEKQGYTVHREVRNCDIVARKADELLVVEMKTRISVALLIQAVDRKTITPSVYVAVPIARRREQLPNLKGVRRLLRSLEVGLITVNFMKTKIKVDVLLHPLPATPRRRPSKQRQIIREIDGRYGEFDIAGSPSGQERITAYKQEAIRIAYYLRERGASSPKTLRAWGAGAKTQQILSGNVYGWFERISRGVYDLVPEGECALNRYNQLLRQLQLPPLPDPPETDSQETR